MVDHSYYYIIILLTCAAPHVSCFNNGTFHKSNTEFFLEGHHLKIGIIQIAPFITVKFTGGNSSRDVDGFVPQIVAWMAEKHKFTFEYIEPTDGAFGAFINGSWNGAVGMAVRGEINMIATALSVTYPRSLVIDFTIPFSYDPLALMIPFPELDSTVNRIVKPFQPEVWGGIIGSLIVAAICLTFISRIELRNNIHHGLRIKTGLFPQLWFLFGVLVNHNAGNTFSLPMRLVVAGWCLMAIVLVNCYTSSLVSYLMAPRFLPLINTVQDLADSRDLKIAVFKFSAVDSALFAATSGPLAKLGDSLRANPKNLLKNLNNIEDKVYYERLAVCHEESALRLRIFNDLKITKKCRLFIAKEPLFPDQHAFALRKSDPMTKILSDELILLRQMGLLEHWRISHLPPPNRCSAPLSSARPQKNERLTLNYLFSAFLLYGVGVVASVGVFLFERLCGARKHKPNAEF